LAAASSYLSLRYEPAEAFLTPPLNWASRLQRRRAARWWVITVIYVISDPAPQARLAADRPAAAIDGHHRERSSAGISASYPHVMVRLLYYIA
jgi:hypothetical protein